MRQRVRHLVAGLVFVALGCAGPALQPGPTPAPHPRACCERGSDSVWRKSVVRTAAELIGARTILVDGRRIAYDCAGVTRAIFLSYGVDLYSSPLVDRRMNGVRRIHDHVRRFGRLHRGPAVQPGDVVFFDHTWDVNGDGRVNDPLTHVGVVERVELNGTVVFISRVAEAIERYRMNLAYPHRHKTEDGQILNDYLRRRKSTDADGTGYLAAELFASYGTPKVP